jgi:hypothetical protein
VKPVPFGLILGLLALTSQPVSAQVRRGVAQDSSPAVSQVFNQLCSAWKLTKRQRPARTHFLGQ